MPQISSIQYHVNRKLKLCPSNRMLFRDDRDAEISLACLQDVGIERTLHRTVNSKIRHQTWMRAP
jgi:hypothetical protein